MKFINTLFICLLFFIYQLILPVFSVHNLLKAQESCEAYITAAEQNYYSGKFNEAIELVKLCLRQNNRSAENEFKALKILCQAYLAKDFREAAREVAKRMLDARPEYSPTIEQEPPPFIVLINEVKSERTPVQPTPQSQSFFQKNKSLFWIVGGGAILIGLTAVLAAGGDDKKSSEPLANPPDWPEKP